MITSCDSLKDSVNLFVNWLGTTPIVVKETGTNCCDVQIAYAICAAVVFLGLFALIAFICWLTICKLGKNAPSVVEKQKEIDVIKKQIKENSFNIEELKKKKIHPK